ncbi:hypothetical protein F0562_012462 [Nyssa sinensis]|uniref:Uncharacterized GPI-anchored protein At5g19230-like domain-containing protein n=1 Tax=Nyssa sinensis TaxID=561372 RepID=A0A5J4ZUT1_9ASTE|nr:hypothetical protein F0562_012462 [Nyssa sinensis]
MEKQRRNMKKNWLTENQWHNCSVNSLLIFYITSCQAWTWSWLPVGTICWLMSGTVSWCCLRISIPCVTICWPLAYYIILYHGNGFSIHFLADEEENLFGGINRYYASSNLSALTKNDKAECLAKELAD